MYQIEKYIPIPETASQGRIPCHAVTQYRKMVVGDSMIVSSIDVKRIRNDAWRFKQKVVAKKLPDGHVRIWRIV